MLRIHFVLPLLSVLMLVGCGDDESCIDQASKFEFSTGGIGNCTMMQTCNGGDVSVFACHPPRGQQDGYALFVRMSDQTPIGFSAPESECVPEPLVGCEL
ncbi:hypothetical protein ACLESD_09335 [Pyxidicoccus sp. 3LFB2]